MKGKIIRFIPSSGTGIIMVYVNGENGKEYQQLQFSKQHYDSSISKHIYKDQEVEVSLKKIGNLYQVENISYDIGKHLYRKAIYSNESSSNIPTPSRYRRSEQEGRPRSEPSRRFSREGNIKDPGLNYKKQDRRRQRGRESLNKDNTFIKSTLDSQTTPTKSSQERQGRQRRQSDSYYSRKRYGSSTSNQEQQPQHRNANPTPSSNRKSPRFRQQSSPKYNSSSNSNQVTDKNLSPNSATSDNLSIKAENRPRTRRTNIRRPFNDRRYRNDTRPTSKPQKNPNEPKEMATSYKQERTQSSNTSQQHQRTQYKGRYRPRSNYKNTGNNYNKQYPQQQFNNRDRYRSRRYQYRMWQQRLAIYLHYKRIKQRKQMSILKAQTIKRLSYRRKHLNIH